MIRSEDIMTRKIKFPLEMAKNVKVRTLEELQEHFNLEKVLGYYVDGKLIIWLNDRYYDDQVMQIKELDIRLPDFTGRLCRIIGMDIDSDDTVDLELIKRTNVKNKIFKDVDEEALLLLKKNWQSCLMEISNLHTFIGNYIQYRLQNEI